MSQQKKFMVSPRALQLAQNNYDISNASSAKPSPKLPQTRTLYRTTSCNHGRYRYERRTPSPSQQPQQYMAACEKTSSPGNCGKSICRVALVGSFGIIRDPGRTASCPCSFGHGRGADGHRYHSELGPGRRSAIDRPLCQNAQYERHQRPAYTSALQYHTY